LDIDYPKDRYEIVVVDNGSTDNTVEIAQEYGAKVFNKPELNISGLRNYGASVAKGSVFAFIDADVVVSKGWLLAAANCLKLNRDIGCAGSFPLVPEEFGWVAKSWWSLQYPGGASPEYEVQWLPSMNMIVTKEAFNSVGGFSTDLITCEDVGFCYRLGKRFKIMYCKDIQAIHYGEPQSLMHLFKKERWRGLSNYDGIKHHGIRSDELPSFILPIYYLILFFWFVLALVSLSWKILTLNFVCWFLPPLLKSYLSARTSLNYKILPQMTICYLVYSIARTVAVLDWIKSKLTR